VISSPAPCVWSIARAACSAHFCVLQTLKALLAPFRLFAQSPLDCRDTVRPRPLLMAIPPRTSSQPLASHDGPARLPQNGQQPSYTPWRRVRPGPDAILGAREGAPTRPRSTGPAVRKRMIGKWFAILTELGVAHAGSRTSNALRSLGLAGDAPMSKTAIPGGFLIAIEGIDGAGKTTLARGIAAELASSDLVVSTSKEPTQGQFGQQLRASAAVGRFLPEEELRLLLADRREHVDQFIRPALDRGELVILDRYYLSNAAYQGAEGLDVDEILRANEAFAPPPDLVLILDVAPSISLKRVAGRGDFANHFEREDTLVRCRAIFLQLATRLKSAQVIDARKPATEVLVVSLQHLLRTLAEKLTSSGGLSVASAEVFRAAIAGVKFTAGDPPVSRPTLKVVASSDR